MPVNECIAYYDAGSTITGYPTTAVVGKRFVMISGNRQTGTTKVVSIAPATAAGRAFGVAAMDAAIGAPVDVERSPGVVVPVTAEGAIVAFAEVQVGTAGKAVTKTAGVAVGYVLTAAADGTDAQVSLY